jgi:cell division septum initiation protein DivIVA
MNRSRKYQITLALISICIFSPILIAKSGEDKTKMKFEIDNKKSQGWISTRGSRGGQGPIRPTHVAIFHIRRPHADMPSGQTGILEILKTSAGKSLSQQQQKFLTASDAITWWGIDAIKNHDTVLIYAVSEEDAKKTVQAYLEVPENNVNERIQRYENYTKEKKQEIIEIKKDLAEKQNQADELEPKYMELKKSRYFLLSDNEAYETAKETMLEMDKMLDVLEIELAGIKEKLNSIEKYRMSKRLPSKRLSEEIVDKLDQMLVEQMIELKSTEARERAATKIRDRDKDFVDLYIQWRNLSMEIHNLKSNLEGSKGDMRRFEERLTNPTPDMLPPEIYQNKVTIYPVLPEQS